MKIIKDKFNYVKPLSDSLSYYFKGLKFATFDIETTGLSPKNSQLILSGFAIADSEEESISTYQIFSQGDDEKEIIEESLRILSKVDYIITYNGASFDVPFLKQRAKTLGFGDVNLPYNLDLYKLVKSFSNLGSLLPNLKQKTLESFLGIWENRADEIDGAQSILLFAEYLDTKDINLEEKILLHNSDDIKQLYRLIEIIDKVDFHKAMNVLGFPTYDVIIEKISFIRGLKRVSISGKQNFLNYSDLGNMSNFTFSFIVPDFKVDSYIVEHLGLYFVNIAENNLDREILDEAKSTNGDFFILGRDREVNYKALNTYAKAILMKALHQGR